MLVRLTSPIFCLRTTFCYSVGQLLINVITCNCLFLCFEVVSNLRTNLAKSKLILVGNVANVDGLASILGYRISSLPMKYLGLPLRAFKAKSIWNSIIEKMECRLADWKRMCVS
jgi:hypothetical protein